MKTEYQYLVAKLQAAFADDPRLNTLDIKIIMMGEKVHLTGLVRSEEDRVAAAEVASSLIPQADVRNELAILEIGEPGKPEVIVD